MRLSISLGLAVTAAVYGIVAQTSQGLADASYLFGRVYLCSIVFAVVGLLFVPFMQIGKQGETTGKLPAPSTDGNAESIRTLVQLDDPNEDLRHGAGNNTSQTSLWNAATMETVDSYLPRWSWEGPSDGRYGDRENVVCEICIKCLEERRVIVQGQSGHTDNPGSGIGARDDILAMLNGYAARESQSTKDIHERPDNRNSHDVYDDDSIRNCTSYSCQTDYLDIPVNTTRVGRGFPNRFSNQDFHMNLKPSRQASDQTRKDTSASPYSNRNGYAPHGHYTRNITTGVRDSPLKVQEGGRGWL